MARKEEKGRKGEKDKGNGGGPWKRRRANEVEEGLGSGRGPGKWRRARKAKLRRAKEFPKF